MGIIYVMHIGMSHTIHVVWMLHVYVGNPHLFHWMSCEPCPSRLYRHVTNSTRLLLSPTGPFTLLAHCQCMCKWCIPRHMHPVELCPSYLGQKSCAIALCTLHCDFQEQACNLKSLYWASCNVLHTWGSRGENVISMKCLYYSLHIAILYAVKIVANVLATLLCNTPENHNNKSSFSTPQIAQLKLN